VSGFDGLIGQAKAVGLLERMLSSQRVPHALVFQGPQGLGKSTAARMFAAALLCEDATSPGCGGCSACTLVARSSHPDVITVRLLQKEKGAPGELSTVIKIEQIREVSRLAGLAPRSGRRRVFVIDPADRMHSESQNALLKTLEEPPGNAVLLLVASRPHLLLPTVRSRCFGVAFSSLRSADLGAILEKQGIAPEEARARAALSGGRPGLALEIDLETLHERREELIALLESLASDRRAIADLAAHAASLAGKDEPTLLDSLELLETLLRDAARAGGGDDRTLVHADLAPRLTRLGESLGPLRAAEIVTSVERLRGYLRFNTNRTLIAESLLAAVAGGPIP